MFQRAISDSIKSLKFHDERNTDLKFSYHRLSNQTKNLTIENYLWVDDVYTIKLTNYVNTEASFGAQSLKR